MNRSIEKEAVFRSDADRDHFCDRLGEIFLDTEAICRAWAARQLGVPMSLLARKLGISIPSGGESVTGGRRIAEAKGCFLLKI
jgi:hypothetical protein